MSEYLFLELPVDTDGPIHWLHWDVAQKKSLAQGNVQTTEELQSLALQFPGVICHAVLPGQGVSYHQLQLPKGGRAGDAALPYLLEEQLCDDLEKVHITHPNITAGKQTDILVVDKALMEKYHSRLAASGLNIRTLLPDYALLPEQSVLVDSGRVSARLAGQAASMASENFATWQQLAIAGVDKDVASPQVFQVAASTVSELGLADDVVPTRLASRLEAIASAFAPWGASLLTGAYQIRNETSAMLRRLVLPVALFITILLVHWLSLAVEIYDFNRRAAALSSASDELYRQTFPGTRVVNARSQMRSKLNAIEQRELPADFLPWLDKIASASRKSPGILLRQLGYQGDPAQVKIQLDATNYDEVDRWAAALAAQGFQVDRGAFGKQGDVISGQLSLRGTP